MTTHKRGKLLNRIVLRIIFLPLIFAVLMLAAGSVIVKTMFDRQNLKDIATDQLQSFFKRPVQIDSARFSLTGEIRIKGLRVVEPGPRVVNFVTAQYIVATYRLAPLLKRQIVLKSVILVSPRIELFRDTGGAWNFSDIMQAYRDQPGPSKNRLNSIRSAEIRDGEVNLHLPGSDYSFGNVNLNLKDFRPGADTPFDLAVFFRRDGAGGGLQGRLYSEGVLNMHGFDMNAAELKSLSMTLSVMDKTFTAEGELKNFRRPEMSLSVNADALTDRDIEPLYRSPYEFSLPASRWTLKSAMREDGTSAFSLRAAPPDVKAEGTVKFDGRAAVYDLSVFTPPISLSELKSAVPAMPVSDASGIVQGRMNISNRTGKPVISKLILTSEKAGLRYKNLRFDGLSLSSLFTKNLKDNYLHVKDGRLTLPGAKLTALKVRTEISADRVAGECSAQWGSNPLKGRFVFNDPFTDRKTAYFTGYSRQLDIKAGRNLLLEIKKGLAAEKRRRRYNAGLAWIKAVKNAIPAGFAGFRLLYKTDFLKHEYFDARDFYLSADLKEITGRLEKLRGTIAIRSGGGTFYNVQKTSERDRVHYILSLPILTMYRLNRMGALKLGYKLNDVVFNSAGGEYALDSGVITIRGFYMAGRDFSIYTTGTLDLARENIKLKVYTISDKYYSMGSLPETFTDESGKPALAFTIEGRMNKPDIKMLNSREAGRIIQGAIKKGVTMDTTRLEQFKEKK